MSSNLSEPPRAVIFGCAGPGLSAEERAFFADAAPLGFILFARNCVDPDQLAVLTADLRAAVGREDAPILIDQEGGRVARLTLPTWRAYPAAAALGRLGAERGAHAARLVGRLMAAELAAAGITVNCAPVLDLAVPGAHSVIGERAYGADSALVAALGRGLCEGLLEGGVLPVLKHIPGHGRARADSHEVLPRVDALRTALEAHDFAPFKSLAEMPWAMTAHVLYAAIDAERPATVSPVVVDRIIRGAIGFDGVLVSDDVGMKALSGGLGERARAALNAGCDLALHCSGDWTEMGIVAAAVPRLGDTALERIARAAARARPGGPVDAAALNARLDELLNGDAVPAR